MKKFFNWKVNLSLFLLAASALTYFIHYLIFHDVHHIFIYMIGDVGFLFIDVLLVVLLIENILARREKQTMMKKLNMVIGTFFSEVGLKLLEKFSTFVSNAEILENKLTITPQWRKKDFEAAALVTQKFSYEIKLDKDHLLDLRNFLLDKRSFMLRLLENPNLLEHEHFTDFLWAIFHLTEELAFRGDKLKDLPEADYNHLLLDLKRAYSQVTSIWISYTWHLKENYPFLFSLAARINPLNPQATPIVAA